MARDTIATRDGLAWKALAAIMLRGGRNPFAARDAV